MMFEIVKMLYPVKFEGFIEFVILLAISPAVAFENVIEKQTTSESIIGDQAISLLVGDLAILFPALRCTYFLTLITHMI